MDFTPYIGAIVAIVGGMAGIYAAISAKLSRLETLIEDSQKLQKAHESTWLAKEEAVHQEIVSLRREVEKHNSVIERVYALEQDTAVHEQRITANEARLKKLEGEAA